MWWQFLKHEKPFPWGVKRSYDLEIWQMMYLSYANSSDSTSKRKEKKLFLDYVGSYFDPQRSSEEFKKEEGKESGSKIMYTNVNFDKDKPPPTRMDDEKKKAFEQAMESKFGGLHRLTGEDPSDFDKDEDFDEVFAP